VGKKRTGNRGAILSSLSPESLKQRGNGSAGVGETGEDRKSGEGGSKRTLGTAGIINWIQRLSFEVDPKRGSRNRRGWGVALWDLKKQMGMGKGGLKASAQVSNQNHQLGKE